MVKHKDETINRGEIRQRGCSPVSLVLTSRVMSLMEPLLRCMKSSHPIKVDINPCGRSAGTANGRLRGMNQSIVQGRRGTLAFSDRFHNRLDSTMPE